MAILGDARQAVIDAADSLSRAFFSNDVGAAERLLTTKTLYVTADGRVCGRRDFLAEKTGIGTFRMDARTIRIYRRSAVLLARHGIKGQGTISKDSAVTMCVLQVWVQRRERWLLRAQAETVEYSPLAHYEFSSDIPRRISLRIAGWFRRRKVGDAEARRCGAINAHDMALLGSLLAADLTYTHSSGRTETKSVLLEGHRAKQRTIHREENTITVVGDLAIVLGSLSMSVVQPDRSPNLDTTSRVTQIWRRDTAWVLIAYLAAPLGVPPWVTRAERRGEKS